MNFVDSWLLELAFIQMESRQFCIKIAHQIFQP